MAFINSLGFHSIFSFVSSCCYSLFWSVFLSHLRFLSGRLYASIFRFLDVFFSLLLGIHHPSIFIAHSYFFLGYAWENTNLWKEKELKMVFIASNEFLVSTHIYTFSRKKNIMYYLFYSVAETELLVDWAAVFHLILPSQYNHRQHFVVRLLSTFDFMCCICCVRSSFFSCFWQACLCCDDYVMLFSISTS